MVPPRYHPTCRLATRTCDRKRPLDCASHLAWGCSPAYLPARASSRRHQAVFFRRSLVSGFARTWPPVSHLPRVASGRSPPTTLSQREPVIQSSLPCPSNTSRAQCQEVSVDADRTALFLIASDGTRRVMLPSGAVPRPVRDHLLAFLDSDMMPALTPVHVRSAPG